MKSARFKLTLAFLLVSIFSATGFTLPALHKTFDGCSVHFNYPKDWNILASPCFDGAERIIVSRNYEADIVVMTRSKDEEISLLEHAKEQATAHREAVGSDFATDSSFEESNDENGYRVVENYSAIVFGELEPRTRIHFLIRSNGRPIYLRIDKLKELKLSKIQAFSKIRESIIIKNT